MRRTITIFGRSIPIWTILVFATSVAALAALMVYVIIGVGVDVYSAEKPSVGAAYTNDDETLDSPSDFDPNDAGPDPTEGWLATFPSRSTMDIQTCTAAIGGQGTDFTVSATGMWEDLAATSSQAFCTVRVQFVNSSSTPMILDDVTHSITGLNIEFADGTACGDSLPASSSAWYDFDLYLDQDATGSLSGNVDVGFGVVGAVVCP